MVCVALLHESPYILQSACVLHIDNGCENFGRLPGYDVVQVLHVHRECVVVTTTHLVGSIC